MLPISSDFSDFSSCRSSVGQSQSVIVSKPVRPTNSSSCPLLSILPPVSVFQSVALFSPHPLVDTVPLRYDALRSALIMTRLEPPLRWHVTARSADRLVSDFFHRTLVSWWHPRLSAPQGKGDDNVLLVIVHVGTFHCRIG